ncbi:hypothetical protein GOV13_00360 [Candidatus Pacearchaeota archaeon]|nr:hypothetical protein [Candidatus Pacearchaeota archaeon]
MKHHIKTYDVLKEEGTKILNLDTCCGMAYVSRLNGQNIVGWGHFLMRQTHSYTLEGLLNEMIEKGLGKKDVSAYLFGCGDDGSPEAIWLAKNNIRFVRKFLNDWEIFIKEDHTRNYQRTIVGISNKEIYAKFLSENNKIDGHTIDLSKL